MARALTCERARACRTGEVFSLLVFSWLEPDDRRAGFRALRRLLGERLRATDQVGWLSEQHVGALLPFADASATCSIVDNLMTFYPTTLARLTCDIYHSEAFRESGNIDHERRGAPGPDSSPRRRAEEARPASGWEGACVGAAPQWAPGSTAKSTVQPIHALFTQRPEWWKRGLDIAGALVGLVLFAPVLLFAMLLIRIVSPGPGLFKQERAGRGGVPFTIYKLRTMQLDAEARKPQLLAANEQDGPAFKLTRDPRVIPVVGRVLRTTSLDELPQLWNVLKGDMTLVGPRPLPLSEAARCEFWQTQRLDVTPGLTGPWQVEGRSRTSFVQWIRMDLRYIRKRSFLVDVGLLAKTIPAVIRRKGAH